LMAFNDERVVRRVARCTVPVVSAVGHEVDVTLTDLVADVRAATPSEAAELLIPDHEAQRQTLLRFERHLLRAQISLVAAARARLSRVAARVSDPRFVIVTRQQEIDELLERMARVTRQRLARGRREQRELSQRLAHRHPERVLGRARGQLGSLSGRLAAAVREQLNLRRKAFGACAAQLDALSPLAVLGRGYAIATRDGIAVLSSQELAPGDIVKVRVAHGGFRAKVTQVEAPADDERLDMAPVSEVRS
jgi:exodeoxyribonuclease VII large subunit